ncbi:adenylyl-sulfate kinase [Geodermatophilus sp. DSM 44513]|uniref:adenylyl-sulfate kinase n=1 Tax=Geodermatophilus sp. DSM 44513 TaxID=1528104 RepID=UPI00127DB742|nr:adenylyl-sulfate kinase [Geodermatophilus sp. DSM 44513]WNV76392.1 adenylyl-sulfate kinase [Geodermatophilus sp. DSM 44513]
MAARTRLTDAQVAALARHRFGLGAVPDLPPAEGFEDAQGVLVAVREAEGLRVVEVPRWRPPADVARRLRERGWSDPAAWVGWPPAAVEDLPPRVLVLLPVAGAPVDAAVVSSAAAAWAGVRSGGREVELVCVPVTAAAPEVGWPRLAAVYGATLAGSRVDPGTARTGGRVLFFTGLSGAGKSTIAARVVELLLETGRSVTLLDGDEVRSHLSAGLGFSRADRDTNVRRIGWVAAQIAKHGGTAVCAPIAPYAAVRADVRREAEEQAGPGGFVLVHVATPLAECEARDRKGLYARARRGEIPAFTGISDPYEVPTDAEVRVDTTGRDVDACARLVLDAVLAAPGPAGAGPA